MTQLGLGIKACKNIPSSNSTLFEKLELDEKAMESPEETAIFNMLLLFEMNNNAQKKAAEEDNKNDEKNEDLATTGDPPVLPIKNLSKRSLETVDSFVDSADD